MTQRYDRVALLTRRGFLAGAGVLVAAGAIQLAAGGAVAAAAPAGQTAGADPYVGEIRMFGGGFAPAGWALCDGSALAIADYADLFNLIGTTYGGDGVTTFALPDLRGRLPMHRSDTRVPGMAGGTELVRLSISEIPAHTHTVAADSLDGNTSDPSGALWATAGSVAPYATKVSAPQPMSSAAVTPAGGSAPHENMPPYLAISFIIALAGAIPPRA